MGTGCVLSLDTGHCTQCSQVPSAAWARSSGFLVAVVRMVFDAASSSTTLRRVQSMYGPWDWAFVAVHFLRAACAVRSLAFSCACVCACGVRFCACECVCMHACTRVWLPPECVLGTTAHSGHM